MSPVKPAFDVDEFPQERVLYSEHPAMFRNDPLKFLLFVALSVVVVGLALLIHWFLQTRMTTLTITERRTYLRRGILSKSLNCIQNEDVRNIQLQQSIFQRLMGVGDVAISTSGQSTVEIEVRGIPDPERVRDLINRSR